MILKARPPGQNNYLALILGWLVLLWGALTTWADYAGFGPTNRLVLGSTRWADTLLTLHVIILGLVLAIPVLAGVLFLTNKDNKILSGIATSFRKPESLYILLVAFTVSPLFYAFASPTRLRTLVGFFAACTVCLILWWLFPTRHINTAHVVLTATWIFAFLATLQVFSLVLDVEERWALAYRAVFAVQLMGLTVAPLLLFVPAMRERAWAGLEWAKGRPLWCYAAVFGMGVLGLSIYWLLGEPSVAQPLVRFVSLLCVVAGAPLALRLLEAREPFDADARPVAYRRWLLLIAIGYLALAIPLAINWVGANTPDTLAYLQIARSYASGNLAVRGMWAPLISWLLVPFIALGIDPEVAIRALVVPNGLIWAYMTFVLGRRFGLHGKTLLAATGAMALLILKYSFWQPSPDYLSATVLLVYFYLVTDQRFVDHPVRFGILAGLVGAIGYYTRYFNLPFVATHLLITGGLMLLHRHPPKRVAVAVSIGLATLAIGVLPWLILLSNRYGYLTIATSGQYNLAYFGPCAPFRLFCTRDGLCALPNDVLFTWEDPDPQRFLPYLCGPFERLDYFQSRTVGFKSSTVFWAQTVLFRLGMLPALALVGLGLVILGARDRLGDRKRWLLEWTLLTVSLYAAGYMVGSLETRYYYPLFGLFVIAIYLFAQAAIDRLHIFAASTGQVTLQVFVSLLLVGPMVSFTLKQTNLPPVDLFNPASTCIRDDAIAMREYLVEPIAGSTWSEQCISYYTGIRTHGAVRPDASAAEADAEVRQYNVATFIAEDGSLLAEQLQSEYGYELVAQAQYCETVYAILRVR